MTERNVLFISHANPEDNVFTTWLGAKLSAAGYEVWADVLELVGGQDWQRRLEDALRNRAIKVLLVGTQHGVDKQGVRNEIQIASNTSKQIQDTDYIIPLKLENFDAPFLIAHAQHIDFSKSWAAGLKELLETLATYDVPKLEAESSNPWCAVQLAHGKEPVQIEENIISNWLKFSSLPTEVHFYDFNSGISIGLRDRMLRNSSIPLVGKNRGFISFADYPSLQEILGPDLPINLVESTKIEDFLEEGWPSLQIEFWDARKHVSNMLRQGLDAVLAAKQLSSYEMSNKKLSWFGQKGVVPDSQIRFGWPDSLPGRRVIRGYSEKRRMHWHYGISPQVTMWPEPHIKLRGNLVFSENGTLPIDDAKKMHRLRRSFTKSWRNARWRDMMLSFLWWITDGAESLVIPFGEEKGAVLFIPTIIFVSPVSMPVEIEESSPEDQDDPDYIEEPFADNNFDDVAEEVVA
ncbi:MAG: toll/interleukin-1 receptor domain-containing protein [Proteobacteria bacterium]|nr:toll/interleukin-1 receptor domain-containing protein [Pseudomonadota bacterium]MDA0967365.1 toll/interleukin-1 receptor domain-containing protein [Pseudomonadota bacterium]